MDKDALENLTVVLVGTLYGGNAGSACRAMANCGLSRLRMVAPDPDISWDLARKLAVHADGILDAREEYATLEEAVADCVAVAGTSRRKGLFRRRCADAREAAPGLLELARRGRVALVFGREDNGLTNEELLLCTHVLQLPASPDYPSYNLAQSVVLLCHELYRAAAGPARNRELETSPLATMALRERTLAMLRDHLLGVRFMEEPDADRMMEGFNRILSRGAWTEADMKLVMGALRQTSWAMRHLAAPSSAAAGAAPSESGVARQQQEERPVDG